MTAGDRDTLTDAEKIRIADPPGADCQCCDCPECHMSWYAIEQVIAARVRAAQAQAWDEGRDATSTVGLDGRAALVQAWNPYLDPADEFQDSED